MPIVALYQERESLTLSSEDYKRAVRAYMESQGFRQKDDSAIQGTMQDMVFVHPHEAGERPVWVETKATTISVREKGFAADLVKYFRVWHSLPADRQFKLYLFAQSLGGRKEWERLFAVPQVKAAVAEWLAWLRKAAPKTYEQLSKAERDDFGSFLQDVVVHPATAPRLEQASRAQQSMQEQAIVRYGERKAAEIERRRQPLSKKSTLVTNLLPIAPPAKYYLATLDAASNEEVFNRLSPAPVPAFTWMGARSIICFEPFNDDNPLGDLVRGKPTAIATDQLRTNDFYAYFRLINRCVHVIARARGMRNHGRTYFFPLDEARDGDERTYTIPGGRAWKVAKVYRHLEDREPYHKKGDRNFVFHDGLEFRTEVHWDRSFLALNPRRYYTPDGLEQFPDAEAIKNIDAQFRGGTMDRNQQRCRDLEKWQELLFWRPAEMRLDGLAERSIDRWVRHLKVEAFLKVQAEWSPMVAARGAQSLEAFPEV